jgi:predicted phage terminase large subunit-like protein
MGAASLFTEGDGAPVHGMLARADKFVRALRYAAAWNAGKVFVPRDAPWLNDFLSEHASFTGVNDKRDDIIDAAVAAFDVLHTDGSTAFAADSSAPAPLRSARI